MSAIDNIIETNNFKIFLGLLLGVDQIHDFTNEDRLAKQHLMTVLSQIHTALSSPAPAAPASGGSPETKMRGGGEAMEEDEQEDEQDDKLTSLMSPTRAPIGLVRTDTMDTVNTVNLDADSAEKADTMDTVMTVDLRAQPYFPEFNANLKIIFISYLFSIKFWDYNYTDPTEKQFQEMIPSNLEDEEDLGDKKDLEDEKTKYTEFFRLFFFTMLPSVRLPPDLDNINKLIYLFNYFDEISKKFFFPVIVQNIISTFKTGGMMRTNRGRVDSANPYPKFAERSAAKRAAAEKAKEAVEKLTAKLEAARKAQMDVEDTAAWMAEFDRLEAEVAAAEADTPMEGEETTQAEAMDEEAEATEAAEEAAEATVKRQKQDSEQPLDERPSTPAPFPPFSEPGSSTNPHPSEPGSSTASDSSAAPPVSKGRASKLPRVEGQNSWVSTASDDEPLAQASSRRNNIKKCINEIEEILKDSMVDIEKLKQWNDIVKTKYSEETVATALAAATPAAATPAAYFAAAENASDNLVRSLSESLLNPKQLESLLDSAMVSISENIKTARGRGRQAQKDKAKKIYENLMKLVFLHCPIDSEINLTLNEDSLKKVDTNVLSDLKDIPATAGRSSSRALNKTKDIENFQKIIEDPKTSGLFSYSACEGVINPFQCIKFNKNNLEILVNKYKKLFYFLTILEKIFVEKIFAFFSESLPPNVNTKEITAIKEQLYSFLTNYNKIIKSSPDISKYDLITIFGMGARHAGSYEAFKNLIKIIDKLEVDDGFAGIRNFSTNIANAFSSKSTSSTVPKLKLDDQQKSACKELVKCMMSKLLSNLQIPPSTNKILELVKSTLEPGKKLNEDDFRIKFLNQLDKASQPPPPRESLDGVHQNPITGEKSIPLILNFIDKHVPYANARSGLGPLMSLIKEDNLMTKPIHFFINNAVNGSNQLPWTAFRMCPIGSLLDSAIVYHGGCNWISPTSQEGQRLIDNPGGYREIGNMKVYITDKGNSLNNYDLQVNMNDTKTKCKITCNIVLNNLVINYKSPVWIDLTNEGPAALKLAEVYLQMIKEALDMSNTWKTKNPGQDLTWEKLCNYDDFVKRMFSLSIGKGIGDFLQIINGIWKQGGYTGDNYVAGEYVIPQFGPPATGSTSATPKNPQPLRLVLGSDLTSATIGDFISRTFPINLLNPNSFNGFASVSRYDIRKTIGENSSGTGSLEAGPSGTIKGGRKKKKTKKIIKKNKKTKKKKERKERKRKRTKRKVIKNKKTKIKR